MNGSKSLHVVFGTGPLGMAVMRTLVARGEAVRMINRSGNASGNTGVEVLAGDAASPDFTRVACRGAAVVYNCTNPPYTEWPRLFPPLQAGILEGAAAAGAKLISAENTYMYGKVDGPQVETLPNRATTRKGRTRAEMAEALLAAHQSGKIRAAIGRGSDFYGPGVLGSVVGDRVFYPVLAGKKVSIAGNPDLPHTLTYIEDFGKALVTLGEHDEALGQIWHVPSPETITLRQFVMMAFEEAGTHAAVGAIPSIMMKGLGLFSPMIREVAEMMYEFDEPFIVDHSKFARAFGSSPTPHREAIRRTLEWYRATPQTVKS